MQVRRPTMNWTKPTGNNEYYNLRSEVGILDDLERSSDALMF